MYTNKNKLYIMARTYRFEPTNKKQGGKKSMFSEPRQTQKNELRNLVKSF